MKHTVEERPSTFTVGDWTVQPELNCLTKDEVQRHIEPKVMKVLLTLASRQSHVFSKEELISAVWPDTFVSDDVLTRCISILRRITEDDPHTPHFIQTVPKMGYRLVAPISAIHSAPAPVSTPSPATALNAGGTGLVIGDPILGTAVAPDTAVAIITDFQPEFTSHAGRNRTIFVLSGLILLVAMLVGLLWYARHFRRSANLLPSSFRTVQFTSYAGEQIQPAFSPDGDNIAFVHISEQGASRRIYIKRIGQESETELNHEPDEQFSPVWSPDGRQIAYLSKSGAGLGLFLATVGSGEPPDRIYIPQEPTHWDQGALSWSADGKSLIFPDHQGSAPNSSIFLLDIASRNAHPITSPPPGWEGDLNPSYSPDGSRIAFTRASETAVRDIYWMLVVDGRVHQLTHDHTNIDSLAWGSGGMSILFSSNRGGKYALWKMALDGSEPERLPVGTEDAFEPAAGPRPGQFAYTQGSAIWSIVRLYGEVAAGAPQSGQSSEPILSSTQQDSAPSLAPDGRHFAIQSLRSGVQEIWIASISGDGLRQLTFMGGPVTGSPAWSNRGDTILFDSRPDGHSHIFLVQASGGSPKQLTFGNANDIVPRWSHDDRTIYFRSNRGGRWQLWKILAAGGNPQPVTSGDGIEPQESKDGKWLYFTRGDENGIWRVPTEGGTETQIADQPAGGYWGYLQVTARGIFYLDLSRSPAVIRIMDPESKQTVLFAKLKQSPPPFAGLSVSDEGKIALITDQRDADRHITLVEPLP